MPPEMPKSAGLRNESGPCHVVPRIASIAKWTQPLISSNAVTDNASLDEGAVTVWEEFAVVSTLIAADFIIGLRFVDLEGDAPAETRLYCINANDSNKKAPDATCSATSASELQASWRERENCFYFSHEVSPESDVLYFGDDRVLHPSGQVARP